VTQSRATHEHPSGRSVRPSEVGACRRLRKNDPHRSRESPRADSSARCRSTFRTAFAAKIASFATSVPPPVNSPSEIRNPRDLSCAPGPIRILLGSHLSEPTFALCTQDSLFAECHPTVFRSLGTFEIASARHEPGICGPTRYSVPASAAANRVGTRASTGRATAVPARSLRRTSRPLSRIRKIRSCCRLRRRIQSHPQQPIHHPTPPLWRLR
jgi:hypothetical protein